MKGPVPYFEMVALTSSARLIVTDSGGVQKEGYFFRTPCVIPRGETEWTELVDRKWNMIAGTDKSRITRFTMDLWENGVNKSNKWVDLYGGGKAAERIALAVEWWILKWKNV